MSSYIFSKLSILVALKLAICAMLATAFFWGLGGTVGNFWPPCGNSSSVQNVYILVQFVSKIDNLFPGSIL